MSELFLTACECSPDGVVLERDGKVVYVNPKFLRMTGEQEADLVGLLVKELRKRCQARLKAAEIDCAKYSAQVSGETVRVHLMRDPAAQRRRDCQIFESNKFESNKMEALRRLVGGVAHDFNNVLTAIAIYTDLLEGVVHGEPAARYLGEIRRSAGCGSERIRQLLAFARQRAMEPRVVSVNATLRGMEDTLRRMLGEDVALTLRYGADTGNVRIDPAQLEQVILNVAMNGRDAIAERGSVRIETSTVNQRSKGARSGSPGASLTKITIADDGCGMDSVTHSHIFEPFFTTKPPGQGSGLGLSTAYGIISQSGGRISVESQPGCGTKVTILLRGTKARLEAAPDKRKIPVRAGSESLLVVDGDAGVRASLKQLLSARGYQVDSAANLEEAMRLARTRRIEVLICDEVLAGAHGNGWAARLAKDWPNTKVLFLSSSGASGRRNGHVFVDKPFDHADLTVKLRQVLDSG